MGESRGLGKTKKQSTLALIYSTYMNLRLIRTLWVFFFTGFEYPPEFGGVAGQGCGQYFCCCISVLYSWPYFIG